MTRQDLSPGAQAVQSAHAVAQFSIEHPSVTLDWYEASRYLILVSVPDEVALYELKLRLFELGLVFSETYEPDYNDELTALAVAPSDMASKVLGNLPLTLRQEVMAA